MHKVSLQTSSRDQILDITPEVVKYVEQNGINSGMVVVYSPHTTAAITVNENADPDVKRDIRYYLSKTIPKDFGFAHAEGNADSHIKGSLNGFSHTFIVEDGNLQLGQWQGIYFMEFDGPRSRNVWLQVVGN